MSRIERAYLRDKRTFGPEDCPEVPTFEAGYLVSANGGWRNIRPVVDADTCTGCLQCYLYCPDGAISKEIPADEAVTTASGDTAGRAGRPKVSIDYDFCKGCGICAKTCRFGALRMEPEPAPDPDPAPEPAALATSDPVPAPEPAPLAAPDPTSKAERSRA